MTRPAVTPIESTSRTTTSRTTGPRPVTVASVPEALQAPGAFDHGRITERKPIGFPQDGGPLRSMGPLFYWAWARSESTGTIALHPHQGFEILSYVLRGELNHRDTLGNRSRVGVGGAQVQQAGSGMSHEEITGPERTDFFQIWLQPDLEAALKREPAYGDYEHAAFPVDTKSGATIKTILGPGSPIALATEARLVDVRLEPGATFAHRAEPGRVTVMVTVEGQGMWRDADGEAVEPVAERDATVIVAEEATPLVLHADADKGQRFVAVEVPTAPPYPLYR